MSKLQKILSGVIVLQLMLAVGVFYLQRPTPMTTGLLVEGYDAETITRVSLTDAEGKQVTFEKHDGQWVLPEKGNYPLQAASLDEVLAAIGTLNTNRLVAATNTSHARLQVAGDTFQRKLVLEGEDGQPITLFVGTSPAASSTHIRLEGENQVYLTNALSAAQLSTTLSSWVDTNYFQIPADQLKSLAIETADQSYLLSVDEQGNWTTSLIPEGQVFDPAKWNTLLASLTNIRMLEPVGKEIRPEYGLDAPAASVVYTYTDESGSQQTAQLVIGSPSLDGLGYYAKLASAAYVIQLNTASAEKITLFSADSYTSPLVEDTAQP